MNGFDALIDIELHHKLFFLLRYTKGPAKALISGCQYMPREFHYNKARLFSQQTFGQKFQIAQACIDNVTMGSALHLNDKAGQKKFSAKLNSCMNTSCGIEYQHRMNNIDRPSKIARQLPNSWLKGWQIRS